VKAKIDKHQGKDSGQEGLRTLVKTHTGKTSSLRPVGYISDQFPTRGIPTTGLRLARQLSASHEKSPSHTTSLRLAREVSTSHHMSPPRTRSLRLTRQVSTSHEKSPPRTISLAPTGAWVQDARCEHRHRHVLGNDSPRYASATAGGHASSSP
jgi:hypothetical protein